MPQHDDHSQPTPPQASDSSDATLSRAPFDPAQPDTTDLASLAHLTKPLACVRCGYNLSGLSIMAVCPECATPIRATLLHAVDPKAHELAPLRRPRLLAAGLVAWTGGALLAVACIWALRVTDLTPYTADAVRVGLLRAGVIAFTVVSALGATTLIRPHVAATPVRPRLTIVGVLAYVPLLAALVVLHGIFDPRMGPAYAGLVTRVDTDRIFLRMAIGLLALVVVACLRPAARLLAQRSVVLRQHGTNRQVLLTLAISIVIAMIGDALRLGAWHLNEPQGGPIALAGVGMVICGSALATLALIGAWWDTLRLRRVILDPPLPLAELIATPDDQPAAHTTEGAQ